MRVLSGIQPSGRLHIGNYFGAMRQHLALQAEHEAFYFIANYHALTTRPGRRRAAAAHPRRGHGLPGPGPGPDADHALRPAGRARR